ncbi:hypothetical protein SAY86_020151 [Trapa natans]|uniref:Protein kinase domain-containing protein n=1 Tax=Trapa natans TaxID=22666 RepID=A0AAN7LMC7_TRANT|nr:hypothetical protein SAY86_020151 [Trapa natans]
MREEGYISLIASFLLMPSSRLLIRRVSFVQFPITAIREIKILKKLNHENIIKLKEVVISPGPEKDEQGTPRNKYRGGIYLVFEYMDHDLMGLSNRPGMRFSIPQIKCYMKQLLTGLHYCHIYHVLHRDIKGSNLLIDNEGNLKLADFGLARSAAKDQNANLTNHVITLWYRPPELLLGATKYGPAVDMWSVGCIFAELLHGKPIFPGKDVPEQLNKIFELCGAPDETNWPGVSKIPLYNKFKPIRPMKRCLKDVFRHFDPLALELLESMLTLDPSQRICARDAIVAEYLWADPKPCDPKSLPKYESSHEFRAKKRCQQRRQQEEAAKRQRFQLPPIQQAGQARTAQTRPGPNRFMHWSRPPVGHRHGMPRGPSSGPNRYTSNQGGHDGSGVGLGYGSGVYPPQGHAPPHGLLGRGPRGQSRWGPPSNYPQAGPHGGSGTGWS